MLARQTGCRAGACLGGQGIVMHETALRRLDEPDLRAALRTTRLEIDALDALCLALQTHPLRHGFLEAVAQISAHSGRLIITGMGKSGLVGRKIAATMCSTGTPAMFLHPGEASHGDLGMIGPDDSVLALSWSGETTELGDIIDYCRRFNIRLIVVTANAGSTAGRAADICLPLPMVREACPNDLTPTSSTTVQAVLGDALAVALIERRGFTRSDFLKFHPGGKLGAQLATVGHLMATGPHIPTVRADATLLDATVEMSRKRFGCTAVLDEADRLVGVFTDGDLRRSVTGDNFRALVGDHMNPKPIIIAADMLASEALRIMNDKAVLALLVCKDDRLIGIIHLHDLLRVGIA